MEKTEFFPSDHENFVMPMVEFMKKNNIVRIVKNSKPYDNFVIVNAATPQFCLISSINERALTKSQRDNAPTLNYNKIWQLTKEEAISGKYLKG